MYVKYLAFLGHIQKQKQGHLGGSVGWGLTSAQVMISWFMSSSPTSGSVLTAQTLEPVSDSVSPSLSAPLPFMLFLSVSQKMNKNVKKEIFYKSRSTRLG